MSSYTFGACRGGVSNQTSSRNNRQIDRRVRTTHSHLIDDDYVKGVAESVNRMAVHCQENIFSFHGSEEIEEYPRSTVYPIKMCSRFRPRCEMYTENNHREFSVPKTLQYLSVEPNSSDSYILNRLSNMVVFFHGKFNHLTIRLCNNLQIITSSCPISGIDNINGENIKFQTYGTYNHTNIEFSSGTHLNGNVDESYLVVHKSVDVNVNSQPLSTSPFESNVFQFKRSDPINISNNHRTTGTLDLHLVDW